MYPLLCRSLRSLPGHLTLCIRLLSSAEVSTALRPFYFLVHPDLFGKHPKEQSENEVNLKSLKNYVDTLAEGRRRPDPKDVRFHVRRAGQGQGREGGQGQGQARDVLLAIRIRLRDATLRQTVLAILRGADLPTDFVDSVSGGGKEAAGREEGREEPDYRAQGFHWEPPSPPSGTGFSPTDRRQPFLSWLTGNVAVARQRLTACEPIRLEIERLQGSICYEYGLADILWDCGWEPVHRRGTVQAFQALVVAYPVLQPIVRGRTIVFGKDSGVALQGEIVLYSGEVRNNWLNVVKTAPQADGLLAKLPLYEKALSMALRGIRVHRDHTTIVMAEHHRSRLRQLVTSLADYTTRRALPAAWPEDLSAFQLAVEGESSALLLSPDGVFVVPASTPGFLIVEFLTGGLAEAELRMAEARSRQAEEAALVFQCINQLGLIQLDRDDLVTPGQMIQCCSRLLRAAARIRYLTHGNHLVVARYYMVQSDGAICVPWDLVMDLLPEEKETKQSEERILHLTMY